MERPILFSSQMVRAILAGRKTQTRRVVKQVPLLGEPLAWCAAASVQEPGFVHIVGDYRRFCPHGQPGTKLWVRETHFLFGLWRKNGVTKTGKTKWRFFPEKSQGAMFPDSPPDKICKDKDEVGWFKRPAIFMPMWASRLDGGVVNVRVERLQDISESDAEAEGVDFIPQAPASLNHRTAFKGLWDSINAERGHGWDKNPWVWVVEFKKL